MEPHRQLDNGLVHQYTRRGDFMDRVLLLYSHSLAII